MYQRLRFNKGITIIEILVVVAVVGIALSSILGLATLALRQSADTSLESRAQSLAKETMEALLNYRDGISWSAGLGQAALQTPYHMELSNDAIPQWQLIQGEEEVLNFTRSIVFDSVSRDANSGIVAEGGTVDPNTKKVTVTVSWRDRGETRNSALQMYITNWKNP